MERLTTRIAGHVYYTKGKYEETVPAECETGDVRAILQRLADFEDTDLTPEKIIGLASEVKRLERQLASLLDGISANRLRDLAAAEKDGRCVVLPCQNGADIDNPLEPMKVYFALKSEAMKYEYRAAHEPQKITALDYTIIKALEDVLNRTEAEKALEVQT